MLIVLALALLLFGAKRVPEIARKAGGFLAELRRASDDFRDQIMRETDITGTEPETPPRIGPPASDEHLSSLTDPVEQEGTDDDTGRPE